MRKKLLAMALLVVLVLSLAACGSKSSSSSTGDTGSSTDDGATQETEKPADDATEAPSEEPSDEGSGTASADGETISLVLWGAEEDQEYLGKRVEAFKAAYPDQNFDIMIGVESESTAKDTVLTDIEAAADVFAFADDQLNDLVDAGALLAIDDNMSQVLQAYAGKTLDDIKAANVEHSVDVAQIDGTMYGFPTSADNGYFMYYDSTVFTEDDVKSWDSLLKAAAEKGGGRKVGMTLASGWYNAGFFYGAGFTTGRNADGTTAIDWNGTSSNGISGVDVVKAMQKIAGDSSFMAIADGDLSNQIASGNLCAVVSGTWDAQAAQDAWGDGYAACILPTYMAGDKEVPTFAVVGCKLVGVNAYSKNSGWAVLLADFITNEESQTQHYEMRQIGPSNKNALAGDAVASNLALQTIVAQGANGVPQSVGGKFWDPTATFGQMIAQGEIGNDDDSIQKSLDDLVAGVSAAVE